MSENKFQSHPPSDTPSFSHSSPPALTPLTLQLAQSASSSSSINSANMPLLPNSPTNTISPLTAAPPKKSVTLDVPGQTRSKSSPDGVISSLDVEAKLVIVMVGLPARGKSYVTNKLCRYLNWQQHNTKLFNVGNTRRSSANNVGPAKEPLPDSHTSDFFAPDNTESVKLREQWAMDTLDSLLDYVLLGPGSVGILDATNTTIARRRKVVDRIKQRSNGRLKVLFLESICSNNAIIEANIRLKLNGPDYKHIDANVAIADFVSRMRNYEKVYQTIGPKEEADEEFQYIKMIDVGRKVVCCNINGHLAGRVLNFLLNFNLAERQIWVTRHGESEDNVAGRVGGDSSLTPRGRKFADAAKRFITEQKTKFYQRQLNAFADRTRILQKAGSSPPSPLNEPVENHFCVWTSMLQRSIQTGEPFSDDERADYDMKEMRMLNELGSGHCDGMTYAEIEDKYPREFAARMANKITYRYPGPGGESYLDVINRLRAVIVELERMKDNVLIIGHRVVCRVLLAYFMNLGREAIGDLDVPLHRLYCLEHKPYGVEWEVYEYNEAEDWFVQLPKENAKRQAAATAANTAGGVQAKDLLVSNVADELEKVVLNNATA